MEVPLGILRLGFGYERNIPPISQCIDDFVRVEIPLKGLFPFFNREGGEFERFTESVHVRRKSMAGQSASDSVDVVGFIVWAGAPCNLMTVARRWRFTTEIRFIELLPENGVLHEVVDPDSMSRGVSIVSELVVGVVQRDRYRERNKLRGKRIESASRLVTGDTMGDRRIRSLAVSVSRNVTGDTMGDGRIQFNKLRR